MSAVENATTRNPWLGASAWRRLFRDRPMIPLLVLLGVLVVVSELARPGIVSTNWAGTILRSAVPLAILAGCQTIAMLTGGIDLSVGAVASMTGFVLATLVGGQGLVPGLAIALLIAALAGLVTGVGVGVFRVHPLIMTLGMSLVVLGLANVWQIVMVQTGGGVPASLRQLGTGTLFGFIPYSFAVFVPVAALILLGLRRTGYGRMLYAVGDNPIAARLSGARAWQVLIVLYVISAVLAGIAGFLISGLTNVASVTLADSYVLPSVAAAVIGGTSIMGGRGGYGGTIVGALILTVITALLTSLRLPGSRPPDPVRGDHRGGRRRLHAGDRRDLMEASDRRSTSRHLGLDLGGTNIKVVVVEHDDAGWQVIDRDQVPTPSADGPDAVIGRLAEVGGRRHAALARRGHGRHRRPGPVRPGWPARPASS